MHIYVVRYDVGVFHDDIDHRIVLQVLTETPNGDPVAAVDGYLTEWHKRVCLVDRGYPFSWDLHSGYKYCRTEA